MCGTIRTVDGESMALQKADGELSDRDEMAHSWAGKDHDMRLWASRCEVRGRCEKGFIGRCSGIGTWVAGARDMG